METPCGGIRVLRWLVVLAGSLAICRDEPARAQPFRRRVPGISEKVTLPEIPAVRKSQLQRLRRLAEKDDWDEALPLLMELLDQQPRELVELTSRRFGSEPSVRRWVPLGYYLQWFLSQQDPEVLARYRRQVDPAAEALLQEALRQRSVQRLEELLERYFCSTAAEEALLVLGEWYLEAGRYDHARWTWSRLLPVEPDHRVPVSVFRQVLGSGELSAARRKQLLQWYRQGEGKQWPFFRLRPELAHGEHLPEVARFWKRQHVLADPTYPDPRTPAADVLARLVLVELYAGRQQQAETALARLKRLYPQAQGTLGGVQGRWADLLARWLKQGQWPRPETTQRQWPSFAGNQRRCARAADHHPRWQLKWNTVGLPVGPLADPEQGRFYGLRWSPVAERIEAPLVFHPVVVRGQVFICSMHHLLVWHLATGRPAWGTPAPAGTPTTISLADAFQRPLRQRFIGTPRYTLNVVGTRLFARIGWPTTSRTQGWDQIPRNFVVCLDLQAQGRELWRATQSQLVEEGQTLLDWSFDGTPVSDGERVFVALRRRGVQHQAYLACLDAETGTLLWKRFIVRADTLAHGRVDQCTHNLLTLQDGVVYFNTNLGAVAAVDARRGTIRWIATYRKKLDPGSQSLFQGAAHWHRTLTPCLYHQGRVVVAAADRPELFALHAMSGHMLWITATGQPEDVIHLLGVYRRKLIASGDRLWWIDVESGKLLRAWPEQGPGIGLGRGVLADRYVYFPARGQEGSLLYTFDADSGRLLGSPMRLPTSGGNLVVAQDHLVVAGSKGLWVFAPAGAETEKSPASQAPNDIGRLLPETPPDD